MEPEVVLAYEFVEFIPDDPKERTLYISIAYCTAVHKCCCGCGREVVTPLSPTSWRLIFDGKTVSLYPSIGSWSLPCQSHYFITKNKVVWAPKWGKKQIDKGPKKLGRGKAISLICSSLWMQRRREVPNQREVSGRRSRSAFRDWLSEYLRPRKRELRKRGSLKTLVGSRRRENSGTADGSARRRSSS